MKEEPVDQKVDKTDDRRSFFKSILKIGAGSLLAGGAGAYFVSLSNAVPQRKPIQLTEIDMAKLASDGEVLRDGFLVRGLPGDAVVINLTCPHLGCLVLYNREKEEFRCPCHRSRFDGSGRYLEGPAKQSLENGVLVKQGNTWLVGKKE